MKQPSLLQSFIRYAGLNILAALGISCYVLADTVFIANGIGSLGLSALNLSLPAYNLINGLGLMLGIGCSSAWSILTAKKNDIKHQANALFSAAILLSLLIGIFFTVIGILFAQKISYLLGADSQTVKLTAAYLRILLMFAPLFMLQNVLVAFVRNAGAPGISMAATASGCLFNVVFDYIFIFPCDLGISGAALATVLSPLVGISICAVYLMKHRNILKILDIRSAFRALKSTFAGSLRFGSTAFITEFSAGIVMAVYNFVILSICGNIGVAAYGIIANLSIVVLAIFTGITQGIQPLCSSAYGKGDSKSIKKLLEYGLILTLLLSAVIYLIAVLAKVPITAAFNSERDPVLKQLTLSGIKIYFIGFFAAGCNIILSAHASARSKTGPAIVITLLRGFALITVLAVLLGKLFGMIGVWLSFPITEILTLAVAMILLQGRKRHSR